MFQGKDGPEASQLQRHSQDFHTCLGAPRPPPQAPAHPEEPQEELHAESQAMAGSNCVLGSRAEGAIGKKSLHP